MRRGAEATDRTESITLRAGASGDILAGRIFVAASSPITVPGPGRERSPAKTDHRDGLKFQALARRPARNRPPQTRALTVRVISGTSPSRDELIAEYGGAGAASEQMVHRSAARRRKREKSPV